MIEGDDLVEKMLKFQYDLKNKKKIEFMLNNTITFSQVFN
jgi:hypothetical protein